MNYMKIQIRRVSLNRMIVFTVLATLCISFVPLAGAAGGKALKAPIAALCFILASLLLMFAVGAFVTFTNYKKSKAFQRLGGFGSDSAEAVNMVVSHEAETAALFASEKLTLTGHWVCLQSVFSIWVLPVSRLIWVYTLISKHIIRGYHNVVFSFNDGKQLYAKVKDRESRDELLQIILREYPHVLTGYDKDLLRL